MDNIIEITGLKKIKVLGLIILTVIFASFMMFFMVSCFKSVNAYSTACTVIGTLIGFLTGVYIPIGNLPESVQTVVKLFPRPMPEYCSVRS